MLKFFRVVILTFFILTASVFSAENKANEKVQSIESVMKYLHDDTPLVPTKVFDNVYCIGSVSVVAWALQTTDGIILIDSMWDNRDAQLIENGMKKLGLNPEEIKYIIITHGHRDHYGGANYLREKYGAKVVMTEIDADLMYSSTYENNPSRSPKTKVDIFVKEQDKITLGDMEVTIVETPGHTPDGLSVIFPVKYKNEKYTAVLWGGTGIPNDRESQEKYKTSAEHFAELAVERGAEIELTAHLFAENGYANLEKVGSLKEGEKNPFIIGTDGMKEYLEKLISSVDEKLNTASK